MKKRKYFVFFEKNDFVMYIIAVKKGCLPGIRSNYGWNETSF
jgi:hypothetical protein